MWETAQCRDSTGARVEETTILCRDYHVNQQVCIDSAIARVFVSHVLGCLGLLLYPVFFFTRTFSFLAFLMPVAWGASLTFYFVRDDLCMFFILQKISWYVFLYGSTWLVGQSAVLCWTCCKGNRYRDVETYLKIKSGEPTDWDVQKRQDDDDDDDDDVGDGEEDSLTSGNEIGSLN